MSQKLNILCVDTSTEACSVAILKQDGSEKVIFDSFMFAPREHTTKILPTVESVLAEANLSVNDLDIVAYGRGPGSFTGVRIGISIAQGLAFGIEKPMVGVSTLQAMAQQAYKTNDVSNVYAAIDARMGEVYFGHYQLIGDLMTLVAEEVVIKPEDLLALELTVVENSGLVGSGWQAYPVLLDYFNMGKLLDIEFPSSKYMLDQVCHDVQKGLAVEPELAVPVYLRDKVTWKKLPGRE
ncbi:tRNA (adenosine(37)-N6)-threonylcarbamoyltransferase complex dimerization subunit type 1 TsaB [Psychromonas sp. Urea-02u-13]|uniref:tRNA (adenosine(37)-N6)-threonylcarbamoyltransferase complex dimerization subunit type 1 TsaB n=1 Tax=Psychromonas sp. Urea-02u-13 TaxID=2058326 RepID=UPI000C331DBD|nr:tRNA (adenosine(37)-N6)-threonylcarbamoyltransferase complex dimerization subunit type 1 TsaB [Psychromonas sp. Urea-02u-13]PKG40039.1 tRNA (adenosine(37)-N6)-threonylcarbamoyltransferase complex dimerization subunit type 1 TsaB [Psychromonas sp. Urea-02u-13]